LDKGLYLKEVGRFLVEIEGREEYNNIVFGNARTWRSSFGRDPRIQPFLLDFNTIA